MKYVVQIEPGRYHGERTDHATEETALRLSEGQAEKVRYRLSAYFPTVKIEPAKGGDDGNKA